MFFPLTAKGGSFHDVGRTFPLKPCSGHFKAQLRQHIQCFGVRTKCLNGIFPVSVHSVAEAVDKSFQLAVSHFFGALHPQTAGGGISGVGEKGKSFFFALGIQGFEAIFTDDDFATDLHPVQAILAKVSRKRNGADHPRIVGHLFTEYAVTTGCRPDELVVFIDKHNRSTVIFRFYCVGQRSSFFHVQHPLHLLVKFSQIFGVVAVTQRKHGHQVWDTDGVPGKVGADALRRAVRADQLRVSRLNSFEHFIQLIIFLIAQHRVILHVVAPLMVAKEVGKFGVLLFGGKTNFAA